MRVPLHGTYHILSLIGDLFSQKAEIFRRGCGKPAHGIHPLALEDALLEDDTRNPLLQIKQLRGKLMHLHRNIWPMREVAGALSRGEFPQIEEETLLFLRDVHDHLVAALDTIDSYRELLNGSENK